MIWSLEAQIDRVERQLTMIEEERHVLVTLRPWFWRVRVWACRCARKALEREATDITDRIRFRRGLP